MNMNNCHPLDKQQPTLKGLVQVSEHEMYQFNLDSKADFITVRSLTEISYP